jgi:hypothetical protein
MVLSAIGVLTIVAASLVALDSFTDAPVKESDWVPIDGSRQSLSESMPASSLMLKGNDGRPTVMPGSSADWFEFHADPHHAVPVMTLSSFPGQRAWRQARGYSLDGYDSYDSDTLREMAAAGDAIAQYELGKRQMSVDPAESLELNYQATVGGFTSSIVSSAIAHRLIAEGRLTAPSAPRWKRGSAPEDGSLDTNPTANLVKAYGWGLVAQMRGDPTGINLNKDLEENLARLNDEQLESACAFARDTYTALERQRASMGFRNFDNTPPSTTIVNLSRAGEMCREWPVKRPSCKEKRAILGDTAMVVYECTA